MRLIRRLRYLIRQRREAQDLAEEIGLHRALAEQAQRAAGLPEEAARASARRLMGNATLASEDARRIWIAGWIESVFQDLRYAVRSLASQPAFTTMSLLALVLGVGLNISLFTAINSIWSHPWNVPEPDRVVNIYSRNPKFRPGLFGFSLAAVQFLNAKNRSLEAFAARYRPGEIDGVSKSNVDYVTSNYFDVLRVPMRLGRAFRPEEDLASAPVAVGVISSFAWKQRYGADPGILNRTIRLDGVPITVIGVAAEPFGGIGENITDLWVPLATYPLVNANDPAARELVTDPNWCCLGAGARLRPGVSLEQAQAEIDALFRNYSREQGRDPSEIVLTGTAMLAHPQRRQQVIPVLAIVFTAFGSILLLACANVSNLLLARAAARQREIAIRVAIGAGRWRVIRQLLTEGLLLAAIASAGGLLLAYRLPDLALRFMGQTPPTNLHLDPDAHVLAYSVGIAIFSALAFGLAPSLRGTRVAVHEAMKQQSSHAGMRVPLRGALLGIQVAISTALLMAAGLLVRGLEHARSLNLGFRTEGVSAIRITLPPNVYNASRQTTFYDELLSKVGSPAAMSLLLPLGEVSEFTDFNGVQCSARVPIRTQRVTSGYFEVLQIPILAGRGFQPEDRARGPIVVNETLARLCWPDRNPIGHTVTIGSQPREVIGVARDAQVGGLGRTGAMYFASFVPDGHLVRDSTALLLPSSMARPAIATLRQLDPRIATEAITLDQQVDRSLGDSAGIARMAGALGALALLLATVGVYGVISYSVEQRRREIGVRMALGARTGQIISLVLRRNSRAVAAGLGAGLLIGAGESFVMKSELYGLSPADPFAYAGVLAILLLAGAAASVLPAQRAARTDAIAALHHE